MIGWLLTDKERMEIEYLLKREMDDIIQEKKEEGIEPIVKRAIEERYQLLFNLYKRMVPAEECVKYMPMPGRKERDE